MMKIKADLHCHTTISDGSFTVKETLELAKMNGLTHLAITNHDTVRGLKEAIALGKEIGITVIPGIEISAYDYKRNRKVHLLGYNFDLKGTHLTVVCKKLLEDRHELSIKQSQIIRSYDYELPQEALDIYSKDSQVLYKQHIMKALMDRGYTEHINGKLYHNLFKGSGPCNLEIEYIDVFKALEAIIADGGIPVLAHPGQLDSYELVEELVPLGLRGIEKYHCSHNEEALIKIQQLADKYQLFVTGGSDFHGLYGTEGTIGSFICPEESLNYLKANVDESVKEISSQREQGSVREDSHKTTAANTAVGGTIAKGIKEKRLDQEGWSLHRNQLSPLELM